MRWGVRRSDASSGGGRSAAEVAKHNADTKMYMDAARKMPGPKNHAEGLANLAANQKKFEQKFVDETGGGGKGLSPETKALLAGGALAAGFGAAYYFNRSQPLKEFSPGDFGFDGAPKPPNPGLDKIKDLAGKPDVTIPKQDWSSVDELAGKPISVEDFDGLIAMSKGKAWYGNNFINDSSFARPEFELPAGHEFYRLTTSDSTSHRGSTYAVHSMADLHRYTVGFRQEIDNGGYSQVNIATWKSTEPVKVPNLTQVLGSLHQVMAKESGGSPTPHDVISAYKDMSGGGWKTDRSKALIRKLREHGYGALVDEMDAGVIGETPLVFFGGDKSTPKSIKPLTKDAIAEAESLLTEIGKPPGRKY